MEVLSHVVFTLKNSRYDFDRVRRKKPAGYLAPTYPLIEGKEEDNRRLCSDFDNKIAVKPDGTKQALWAKSLYQRILLSDSEVQKIK